ncbi:NADH-ubiquinone oxidoreductase 75 kDa subunit, mitochondrial-like [Choristoneura fumiferana]|uniref:NADH-ubiquinone oxidoreductase 75 kDa subunit, mitochondrial-like n=1 Tax=Choristoneura fumiferana TaxID=7141 RepID=UPI003D15F07C
MFKSSRNLLKGNIIQCLQRRTQTQETPIFINGKAVNVPSYFTIMQALRRERVTIPSFCYHDRLSIAGNCRMCLVHVEGMFKPQIACALPVMKNMKIRTNSDITFKAQEAVLEFILADHPLDCPICDQGGECDLQDLSMKFGNDRTRFTDIHFEGKRAVENKRLGPFINCEMNRCIHCTRCIRFAAQVCGMDVLGTSGRGHDMLVGTYVDKMFLSELSGNIIDLCPVGALTSIPYRFKARPWEVKRTNSIDVTDATGTNIVINSRYDRVIRILPREHEEINQEWLSDKGRWAVDSVEMQRLVTPMYRSQNCLCPTEWECGLTLAANLLECAKPESIMVVAGPHTSVETLVTAKDFVNILGSENTYVSRGLNYSVTGTDIRAAYSLNIKMSDICKADKILLVGTNPRFEAPILNSWIRQAYRSNECDIYVVGPACDYNYHVTYLGTDGKALSQVCEALKTAKKPLIFVGVALLDTSAATEIMSFLIKFSSIFQDKDWHVLNVITREASFAGALEAGWKPGAVAALQACIPSVLICLGADEIFYNWTPPAGCSIIYIGFQGDRGAEHATVVLPGSAYTEAGGLYLNMECRSQHALPAVSPPGKARVDWKIIRALAEFTGICMSYSDLANLHLRMGQVSPNFNCLGTYQEKLFENLVGRMLKTGSGSAGVSVDVEMKTLQNYYCADVFTYNSPSMVKAQKAYCKFLSSPYSKI